MADVGFVTGQVKEQNLAEKRIVEFCQIIRQNSARFDKTLTNLQVRSASNQKLQSV
jgi:hypothetical protein